MWERERACPEAPSASLALEQGNAYGLPCFRGFARLCAVLDAVQSTADAFAYGGTLGIDLALLQGPWRSLISQVNMHSVVRRFLGRCGPFMPMAGMQRLI